MTRLDDETVLTALDAVYEAALDPGAWPVALARLNELVGGVRSNLMIHDTRTGLLLQQCTIGFSTDFEEEYARYFILKDFRARRALSHPRERLFYDYLAADEDAWRQSEFYAWECRVVGEHTYALGLMPLRRPEYNTVISLGRREKDGHASRDDIALVARLGPHVARAIEIGRRLELAGNTEGALAEVIDTSGQGVVLFNRFGRVIHANASAEAIMARAPASGSPPGACGRRGRRRTGRCRSCSSRLSANRRSRWRRAAAPSRFRGATTGAPFR
ncbi:MAG: hypothetical protein GC201_01280 [Alphaproteobacteria bacterium]|nr:hypothetical protein [Alphaproteobacteria bacterium]